MPIAKWKIWLWWLNPPQICSQLPVREAKSVALNLESLLCSLYGSSITEPVGVCPLNHITPHNITSLIAIQHTTVCRTIVNISIVRVLYYSKLLYHYATASHLLRQQQATSPCFWQQQGFGTGYIVERWKQELGFQHHGWHHIKL